MNISTGFSFKLSVLVTVFFVIGSDSLSQPIADSTLRMVFYNTENLFDAENDTLTDDDDFLPGGAMHWSYERFVQKINSLYKVLTASGGWDPPALAGLCEIENRKVLETLLFDTYLSKYNFGIVQSESNDPRGIDVGIIYRKEILTLLTSRQLIPEGYSSKSFRTRNIVYAKFLVGGDTIHLFLNHWPSRRAGVLPGESLRKNISLMIKQKSDSICKSVNCQAKIIIAGDFNCTPDDEEIKLLEGGLNCNTGSCRLINLSELPAGRGEGTYKYQGTWEMLDQVIVSGNLLKNETGVYTAEKMLRIFNPDFLLERDPKYPGFIPFSTYKGYRYRGGYSDHLPVILDLAVKLRH